MPILRSKMQRCVSSPRGSIGVSVSHEQNKGSLILATECSNVQWTHTYTGRWGKEGIAGGGEGRGGEGREGEEGKG